MISVMNSDCELDRKPNVVTAGIPERIITVEVEPSVSGFDGATRSVKSEETLNSDEGFASELVENKEEEEIRVSDDLQQTSESSDGFGGERLKFEQVMMTTSSEFDFSDLEFRVSDVEPVVETSELLTQPKGDVFSSHGETKGDFLEDLKEPSFLDFKSACSRVDEEGGGGATTTTTTDGMSEAFGSEAAKALRYGFEPGDMVWGKVKSHPWWPGQIFNWAFASSSVRYTKREGHLLVAFFGDSSYGWFDPTDLIPFDIHYAEKSQQTNSRAFVKAVEEAVDEAKRRAALGLTCYCRDPINFRYTKVEGYFAVDVCGYEPGGLYSLKQIKSARDNYRPVEALSFVQRMAMEPLNNEQKDLDYIKNVAMFLAYRKATFEERDETYSQAFGTPLIPTTRDVTGMLDHPAKCPSPASLSAPVVSAEGLGELKSSTKPSKVKGQSKKDKYLLKRRAYANELYAQHFNQDSAGLVASSGYNEAASMSGDFVLQKRPPAPSMMPQASREQEETQTISSVDEDMISSEAKYCKADARAYMNQLDMQAGCSTSFPVTKGLLDGNVHMVGPNALSTHPLPNDTNLSDKALGIKSDSVVKKVNLKRPANMICDKTIMGEMKKKKVVLDAFADHSHKQMRAMKDGEALRKDAGKSVGAGLVLGGNLQVVPQRNNDGTNSAALSDSIVSMMTKAGLENFEIELPQLLSDLLALALDPFHGTERYSPAIVRQVLLLFRSLVYQKSLVPPSEAEASELYDSKSAACAGAAEIGAGENRANLPPKMSRPLARPDDPTKAGRKRSLSDRQEDMSAKRIKKVKDLKSLTAEKKSGSQKHGEQEAAGMNVPLKPTRPDILKKQGEQREAGVTAPSRSTKPDTVKKPEQLVRVAEPTMLVMMFPPRTTLPSVPELKAKFARFGPLDPNAFRVFWKSSSCRVVFKYKPHAQAAYSFAVRNKGFFGNIKVHYQLKDVSGGPAPEVPESVKGGSGNDSLGELRRSQQPAVHLKSCLKKPLGEETETTMVGKRKETTTAGTRKDPRVKFVLDGEESSRKEQMMMDSSRNQNYRSGEEYGRKEQLMMASYRNIQKNKIGSSEVGGGSSSPSLAMDVNSKNFRNNIPSSQPLPPLLPLPPPPPPPPRNLDVHENLEMSRHFQKSFHSSYTEQKNHNNYTTITSNKSIDISTQMLTLLLRCNDIVTDVTRSLGYVPYHPL